jgi:hypothetical protein
MEEEDCLTVEAIKAALRRAKSSAPDAEGIKYKDINKLSDEESEELLT